MDQKIPEPLSKPVEPTKPGANVAPEQAHAAMATSTPMGTPAANVGKSGRGKSLLIGFIILLLAAGCASMGYMLWKAQKDIDILNADHKAALEEMDKKRAELEAQIKEMQGGESGSDNQVKTDEDQVNEWVDNQCALSDEEVQVSKVVKIDGNFAEVNYLCNGDNEGPEYYLKRTNNKWYEIYSGVGPIPDNIRSKYQIPNSMPNS